MEAGASHCIAKSGGDVRQQARTNGKAGKNFIFWFCLFV
jgi:hypothetical protein